MAVGGGSSHPTWFNCMGLLVSQPLPSELLHLCEAVMHPCGYLVCLFHFFTADGSSTLQSCPQASCWGVDVRRTWKIGMKVLAASACMIGDGAWVEHTPRQHKLKGGGDFIGTLPSVKCSRGEPQTTGCCKSPGPPRAHLSKVVRPSLDD